VDEVVCAFLPGKDRNWTGQWLQHPTATLELRPEGQSMDTDKGSIRSDPALVFDPAHYLS
jgi:hypothetical protein